MPPINATKSLTGHSQGAAGVHEAIYTLLMMQDGFICESANIEELDPAVDGANSCASASTTPSIERALCPTASASAAPMPRWCSSATTQ